ncbi:MAG: hypothetical protein KBD63_04120 [Bacteriovoracaceae bacterium]|nr:hypothetical protein [Bacteriovoracaceae bacterium]
MKITIILFSFLLVTNIFARPDRKNRRDRAETKMQEVSVVEESANVYEGHEDSQVQREINEETNIAETQSEETSRAVASEDGEDLGQFEEE